ncbi:MAG: GAF domain-containing protein, partial [Cyanobacteriota bacterium]|nr:GAF domain-containing protein [Cyanobacteriota bacterium]
YNLSHQAQQESFLAQITSQIWSSWELQPILETAVTEVRALLEADRVIVYQFAADQSGSVVAESVGDGWTASLNQEIQDTCFQKGGGDRYKDGHRWSVNNIYDADLSSCHRQLLEQFEVKANLVIPIFCSQVHEIASPVELWGLLIVHQCDAPRCWEESDLILIDRVAGHLTIAIQTAQRVQELQESKAAITDSGGRISCRFGKMPIDSNRARTITKAIAAYSKG